MDLSEWEHSREPGAMLEFAGFRTSERKLRLCSCAFVRYGADYLTHPRAIEAIDLAERFADGLANERMLRSLNDEIEGERFANAQSIGESIYFLPVLSASAENGARAIAFNGVASSFETGIVGATASSAMAAMVRDIISIRHLTAKNPFVTATVDEWLASWNGGTVRRLAHEIYADRELPIGRLHIDRLLILADALEDAGCTDGEILAHCRGPGPHVRGCWVIDLLLGKS